MKEPAAGPVSGHVVRRWGQQRHENSCMPVPVGIVSRNYISVERPLVVPRCHVPEDQPPSRLEPTYNMEHDSDGDPLSSLLAMLRAKMVRDFKNRGMSVA